MRKSLRLQRTGADRIVERVVMRPPSTQQFSDQVEHLLASHPRNGLLEPAWRDLGRIWRIFFWPGREWLSLRSRWACQGSGLRGSALLGYLDQLFRQLAQALHQRVDVGVVGAVVDRVCVVVAEWLDRLGQLTSRRHRG